LKDRYGVLNARSCLPLIIEVEDRNYRGEAGVAFDKRDPPDFSRLTLLLFVLQMLTKNKKAVKLLANIPGITFGVAKP
jgi:hypothetical protein